MASDLSSGCTEVIEIFDEKEEGEISLEDVSSSEEGQLNDASNSRRRASGQCPSCLSTKSCASWCRIPTKRTVSKNSTKKDAVQEKENCHHTKDCGYSGSKHSTSTLQENNNDLIPISSDSDMEIVGLADNVKPPLALPQLNKTPKVRKRRRKKRSQNNTTAIVENVTVSNPPNTTIPECSNGPKHDSQVLKDNHLPKNHHRRSNSPHNNSTQPFTRSRISKSPLLRRHRSPFGRARSPVLRKSPIRRTRSPVRRSPALSPTRSPVRRQSRNSLSPSNASVDVYGNVNNKLLKKVRHLKNVGTHSNTRNSAKRKGRGPSLKDKLNNMMKNNDTGDNISDEITGASNNGKKLIENVDDEEDLALLRKMALETKPKRNEKDSLKEVTKVKDEKQQENNDIVDDDVEDLELRMIALRSAMLKKHQDRMQRGVVPGKNKKLISLARNNTESPFSQSFLDSIPIPGEQGDNEEEEEFKTPNQILNENTNPEDMELDSEVELEKEKDSEPYSPTDDISREINVDSELLGIQPSDVSFITPNSQISVISNNSNSQSLENEKIDILEIGASFLPTNEINLANNNLPSSPQSNYCSETNVLPNPQSPIGSLYSPTTATDTLANHPSTPEDITPYSPSHSIDTPKIYLAPQDTPYSPTDTPKKYSAPQDTPYSPTDTPKYFAPQDTPYSPTDTPTFDLELNNPLPSLVDLAPFQESDSSDELANKLPTREKDGEKRRKRKRERALIEIPLVQNLPEDIGTPSDDNIPGTLSQNLELSPLLKPEKEIRDKDNASETSSLKVNIGSAFSSPEDSPDSTMIVVNELPETDLDGSPLVPVSREIRDIEIYIPANISREIKMAQEPLYLQGVPNVTKDANKIPTLVNRSLVPASILKSNKNLQQPLPPKKIDSHIEPAFKSADMQPVQISNETIKTNTFFKPIKLAPVIKKPQLRMVTPAAFNCSSNDNSILEDRGEFDSVKSSAQGTSKNEARNLTQVLQNYREVLTQTKIREATDLAQSENPAGVEKQMKTLPLATLEPRINLVPDIGKNNDALEICNRKSAENVDENLNKGKKTRSRRSRSNKSRTKHVAKTVKDDKSTESKETTGKVPPKAKDDTACIDVSSIHKQTLAKDVTQKNKNFRDNKSNKPIPERSKRGDREERRDKDKRSGYKYDKISNNQKTSTDASKHDNRRISNRKQQNINTEMIVANEHASKSNLNSLEHGEKCNISQNHLTDVDNMGDSRSIGALNIHENTANDRSLDIPSSNVLQGQKSTELINKIDIGSIANVPTICEAETKSVENSSSVLNIRTNDSENSTSNITECKKVDANKRRRSSYDDDEDTLRAILLASLAKRSKPSDGPNNCAPKTNLLADLSLTLGNISTESVKDLPNTPGTKISVSLVYDSSIDATPPSLGNDLPNLGNSDDKNLIPVTLTQAKVSDNEIAKSDNTTQGKTVPSINPLKRKSISSNSKGPLKKIVKKVPISASTKVVNNAKKYQNTLVQKKLQLQKVATVTSNAQKTLGRTNLSNKVSIDGARTRSMITQPLSDTQRFVINLASDSESENETVTSDKSLGESINSNKSDQKPILAIPMSDFEKSVDIFLKDVRKKQETAAAIKPIQITQNVNVVPQKPASPVSSVHRKSPVLSTTPLAVRHLPVSLQEEYRRLKQQILEREKLKLHSRVVVNNMSPLSPSSKSSGTPPGPLSPASPIASPTMSKQINSISPSAQSQIITIAKDCNLRNVGVQSNSKNVVSSITTRVSPVVSKSHAPISSLSNLSIQIPNEATNTSLINVKRSSNLHIPANTSQNRLVTAVKTTQDSSSTKDLKKNSVIISVKDQLSLKNVQVQLQQGKTGRRVSLGETNLNLGIKQAPPKNKETEARESPAINKAATNTDGNRVDKNIKDSNKTLDAIDIREKCNNSVDSSASTLIISREEQNKAKNNSSVDSSASTIIIPRNDNITDSSKTKSTNLEISNKVNSLTTKSSTTIPQTKKLKNNTETWEKIRGDVKKELDSISALPSGEKKTYLTTVEQNLVKKRYAILEDLSEISGNLKQLEMEREVQSNMASEVKKLQEQLKLAEERLQAQKTRVNKMVPNISAAYEKFNSGRRECVKMTRICLGLGCLVIGANYKIPAAGVQLLNDRLKQVAGSTRQLSNKKISVAGGTGDEKTQNKISISNQTATATTTSNIEISLESPQPDSTPINMNENSVREGGEDSTIINSVSVTEDGKNSNKEFPVNVKEREEPDIVEGEETLKLGETVGETFTESIPKDPPQQTSTPNCSKEISNALDKRLEENSASSISTFVLDSPGAGTSGRNESLENRRFLLPYKSVLTHLTVARTTDPSGILCPYELMGTCRDEDCQFVHQSARNG